MTMDNCVERGRETLKEFKEHGTMTLPEEMTSHDFDVWRCIFEDEEDLTGWRILAIEGMRRLVRDNYEDFISEEIQSSQRSINSFLNITALLAITSTNSYHVCRLLSTAQFCDDQKRKKWIALFRNLYPEVVNLWQNAYKDVPAFAQKFAEEYERFGEGREKDFPELAEL